MRDAVGTIEAQALGNGGRFWRTLTWGLAALLGLLIAMYAIAVLSVGAMRPPLVANLLERSPLPLVLHLTGGSVALAVGAFQLSRRLRARQLALHRWLGRIYVVGVLIGGVGGLLLAFGSDGGLVAHVGFGFLAVLWLTSTLIAYVHIRNRRVEQHRAWMLRSYALTFAAVTLRIWLPLSQVAGIPILDAYQAIAWLCWVPNLLVVEWLVLRR
jgi:uncharacterized membrane protein